MVTQANAGSGDGAPRRPSVRKRLLTFLLVPTLALMVLDTGFVYMVALRYSSHVHDRDLAESTLGLAKALQANASDGHLSTDATQIIEFDPDGRSLFAISSGHHGFVSGSAALAAQATHAHVGGTPLPYDAIVDGAAVRVESLRIVSPRDPGDRLTVSVAEALHDRQRQAGEILWLTIPVEALLVVLLMALVWQGVKYGLRILDAPIRRLSMRERNLAPISGPDIPIEILPLTRTIDGLFERIAKLVELQERFVADAAHQLRTPLAGLSMHVERALSSVRDADTAEALRHIRTLTARMTRSATQLLALARLQAPSAGDPQLLPLDLSRWLPDAVSERIPQALQAGIDLGYEDCGGPVMVAAGSASLQELIDNLIDNAIAHVGREGTITVSLSAVDGVALVAVDDDGPGVADEYMSRLGERFFRAPGAVNGGSGLGLAIVRRIAEAHAAGLDFCRSAMGGLRVEIRFPQSACEDGRPAP